MVIAFTVLSVAMVAANMVARLRGPSWWSFTFKTASGVLFCVLGGAGLWHIGHLPAGADQQRWWTLGVLVAIGLFFGLAGDIALGLKDLIRSAYNRFMLSGFILFALGHIAYVAGLLLGWQTPFPWVPILVCLLIGVAFVVSDKVLRLHFGRFKWVVATYSTLLALLPAMGLFTMATGTHPVGVDVLVQPTIMAVVGVCFVISDLILAWTYFGSSQDRGWEHTLCYVFYYVAQFGIAASLFWL